MRVGRLVFEIAQMYSDLVLLLYSFLNLWDSVCNLFPGGLRLKCCLRLSKYLHYL
jgi:hypothetical protein